MLWEMLYSIPHNGKLGRTASCLGVLFIVSFAFFIVICCIGKKGEKQKSKKYYCEIAERRQFCENCSRKLKCYLVAKRKKYEKRQQQLDFLLGNVGKLRKVCGFVVIFMGMSCVLTATGSVATEWRTVGSNSKFCFSPLAEQKNIDILFMRNKEDDWKENSDLQKLHILEDEQNMEITAKNVEYFNYMLEQIYQNGRGTTFKLIAGKDTEDIKKTRGILQAKTPSSLTEHKQVCVDWHFLYEDSGRFTDLYWCIREAWDIVELGSRDMFEEDLLNYAAMGVSDGEIFLQYENRNINTSLDPVIIGNEDIAFGNAKMYYQCAEWSTHTEKWNGYTTQFWMISYAHILQMIEIMSEDDKDYAKGYYYVGNIKEKMLSWIPEGTSFYQQTAQEALEAYIIAENSLEQRPGYYNKEKNMEKNIKKGMRTLTDLLKG